jgi:hypothetical protein
MSIDSSLTVHVISCNKSREEKIISILKSINLNYIIHRFTPDKDKTRGCYNSHISLYKYADEHNMDYIFCMEDNIKLNIMPIDWNLPQIDNCNILYLGAQIYPSMNKCTPINNRLVKTESSHGLSAYIIYSPFYKRIMKQEYNNIPIDNLIEQYHDRYLYLPLIFCRDSSIRSIVNTKQLWWRNIYLSNNIQNIMLRLYKRNIMIYHYILIIFLIILILVILWYK